jgi:hypothetical protein
LEKDALAASHPLVIRRKVEKLSEIDNWFDDITYEKGGAVLRMLRAWMNQGAGPEGGAAGSSGNSSSSGAQAQGLDREGVVGAAGYVQRLLHHRRSRRLHSRRHLLTDTTTATSSSYSSSYSRWAPRQAGQAANHPARSLQQVPLPQQPDPFMAGLTSYLKDRQYKSGTTESLFDHLGKVSGQPIPDRMATWAYRRGFPIVTVSLGGRLTEREPPAGADMTDGQGNQVVVVEQTPFHAPRDFVVGLPFESDMYCNDMTGGWWVVRGRSPLQWMRWVGLVVCGTWPLYC